MHGELDKVYDTMRRLEEAEGVKIDLLICCGDFQVRLPRASRSLDWSFFWPENIAYFQFVSRHVGEGVC
jgi:hypothetical protein